VGRRSRKRGSPRGAPPARPKAERRLSAAERDAKAREGLKPLAPSERPAVVVISALMCLVIAVSNVVLWAVGWEVDGRQPNVGWALTFAALMLVAAVGIWQLKYWAILGFQALLALTILVMALALTRAANLAAVAFAVAVIAVAGLLFWKLIRVMARIQLPNRPGR
jgi:hypothetical protein